MRALLAMVGIITLVGCDYHRRLGTDLKPQPTSPLPGAGTGNGTSGTTPTLSWTPAEEADSYEVQLDDSCQMGVPCDFPSPEIDVFVTDPSYVPATPLTVPSTGPRSQTYCWRVRGCHQGTCGEWSDPRCFVVGANKTLNRDLNGDGYADLVIGAPRYSEQQTDDGRVGVYLGGPKLPDRAALVLRGERYTRFGNGVATVGNLNGDIYGDYVVVTGGDSGNMNGNGTPAAVRVYFGGPVLRAQPDVVFKQPDQQYQVYSPTGVGDLNGDGYDDLAFIVLRYGDQGSPDAMLGPWVEVHFGGQGFATAPPLIPQMPTDDDLPIQIAAAGDVNGDGYPDLLVSYGPKATTDGGGAALFYGGPVMDAAPDVVIPWQGTLGLLGAGVGDVNGDGYADVALAAPGWPSSMQSAGLVHLYFGGPAPHTAPDLTLAEDFSGEQFATGVLAAGDLDGDGYADLAVLSAGTTYMVTSSDGHSAFAEVYPGHVSLFAGGIAAATTPFATVTAPAKDHPYVFGGSIFDLDGDGLSEILLAEWSENGSSLEQATQVAIHRASNGYTTPARVLPGFRKGDDFGSAMSQ